MKNTFTLFLTFLTAIVFAQAPVNDDCAGIIDLGEVPYCSQPAQYTNVDATTSDIDPTNNIPACFNNGTERDVWFQFTLPADGSIVDITITVFGDFEGNGTLQLPQVAIYRGDCAFGELAELDCASAIINENVVSLDQFGLTPGIPYFLRINDYSATAAPNWGTFRLCIEKYVPEVNIGDVPGTQSCTGTLWDSGGPTADYSPAEDLTFTICPQEYHECIVINLESYDTEFGFDFIGFYAGDNVATGTLITQQSGFGNNFEVQIPAPCATIRFNSDGFAGAPGFKLTWTCSPNACTTPPPTTCADPEVVASLPYGATDLSNCFSGNTIQDGPCNDAFLSGNDYVFAYTSQGDECIQITTAGTNFQAGIAVYNQCPSLAGTACVASAGGGFNSVNPSINAAFLENPGTYYIVFGAGFNCSPFDISMDTVTCPVVLPSASTCDNALNIGGCSNLLPEIIALNPGNGDPAFIQQGINQGCFVAPQQNFAFFYFVAGADGKFGFTVQSADPAEASDIDFNVWGPIDSVVNICDFVTNIQPIRSSWAGGADPTGLADIHPVLNTPVTDDFDCGSPASPGAGGDDFVRRIDVLEGQIYVILLDDFGNAIEQNGIAINFNNTEDGVLTAADDLVTVSPDTAVCAGEPIQLLATGGAAYFWEDNPGMSCTACPNPLVIPLVNTSYQVQVATACNTISEVVNVKIIELELGPDVTVCNNASFQINPDPYDEAVYSWVGGTGLSCYDCPTPTVAGLATGVYTYIATLSTPQCTLQDTLLVTVIDGEAAQYTISDDLTLCVGTSVDLGGAATIGTNYNWTSVPTGFVSVDANPMVVPTQTTTFFLEASNGSCPLTSIDSVSVTVFQLPILNLQGDTTICQGETVQLAFTVPEAIVTYAWTPANDGSIDNPTSATPLATPQQTTTYTLVATNGVCTTTNTLEVNVVNIAVQLSVPDTVRICIGESLSIVAAAEPTGTNVVWTPTTNLQLGPNGSTALATPGETTLYTATVSVPGCVRQDAVYVRVDSLPGDLSISPADTSVCFGNPVLLVSPIYEPAEYPEIDFSWTPGGITPDSLYNLVATPTANTVYQRISRSGACVDTATANITVIQPAQMSITPAVSTICPGESVALTLLADDGVTDVEWSPSSTLSCSTCDDPIATPEGTTTYTVDASFMGCDVGASATVVVQALPALSFPNDTQLCAGESITLNLANDASAIYTWTSSDPAFGTLQQAQPTVTPTLPTATYFVTANNGCQVQGQITVTVTSATLTVSNDTTICRNLNATLNATGTQPGSFVWSSGQTGQTINVMPDETTVYTVTYTFGDNCVLVDQVLVSVQGDGAAVTPPNDLSICPGEAVVLNVAAPAPGATYSWVSDPPGFTSSDPTPVVSPGQTTTYTVTTTLGICTGTSSITVTAFSPVLTVSPDTLICEGGSAAISANANVNGSYVWTPGGMGNALTVSPDTTTMYDLIFAYGDGCTLTDGVIVEVQPNFMLGIVSVPDTNQVDLGTEIMLGAVVTPEQNLNNFNFVWTENGTTALGNTQDIEVVVSSNDTTIFYTVQAVSPAGCVQEATISFNIVQPFVQIPNAFTPDGDGTNDDFGIFVREGLATIDQLVIYNRWGNKIVDLNTPDARWNGQVDGKNAPSDVYVYIIRWKRGDGKVTSSSGEVTLIR